MSLSTRLARLEQFTTKEKPALILFLHNAGCEGAEPQSIDGFERLPGEEWPAYRERAKRHHEQQPGNLHILKVRYADNTEANK